MRILEYQPLKSIGITTQPTTTSRSYPINGRTFEQIAMTILHRKSQGQGTTVTHDTTASD
ncbi:hypothetical protein A6X21_03175 [Planctopirus hydrillae]|uniref:Uncharacterized protein n=1 Tax=Planctopirus hydrillae TaxID=1841610 RepID=A0A1C3ENA8_9PLAN|nr:hypothetical protein A6X21_03175 [Planctopirus hydrillae]